MGKSKDLWKDNIVCPWCEKTISVRVEKEVIEPALPAQTKVNVFIDKQETL